MPELPPWEAVAPTFRERYPDMDQRQLERAYRQRALEVNAEVRSKEDEPAVIYAGRRSIAVGSSAINVGNAVETGRARERMNRGEATPQDYEFLTHMRTNELRDQRREGASYVASGLAHLPALVGEAYLGGALVSRLAPTAVSEAAPIFSRAAISSPRAFGLAATKKGADLASMPSMWTPEWTEGNLRNNRDALDPRGLPRALTMGYLNMAVLGSLGGFGNSITATGVRGTAAGVF